jgi:phage terminase large subunit GpA-like protein
MSRLFSARDLAAVGDRVAKILAEAIPFRAALVKVSEWAEAHRILPAGLTSRPGPFRFSEVEPMREIVDCLSATSPVREVALMKGAQLGGTVAVIENFIGYIIDAAPGPTMAITGDADMAETWMEKRIDPMLASCGLQKKIFAQVQKAHGKKTGDTKNSKEFPGGFLLSYGPKSGSKLRSNAIQYLLLDEEDAYPVEVGSEGDPISLAVRRTDTYESSRKILHISTPLVSGISRIESAFLDGDQRRYFVPCKKCGTMQVLDWKRMKYSQDDSGRLVWASVGYECINDECGAIWKNADKAWFLPRGEWIPSCEPKKRGMRSYHLSSLYAAPGTRSWESIAEEWISARDDPIKLRVFINTVLGEPWEERGESPQHERIMIRRDLEPYNSGSLPPGANPLVITLGADVQADRIECEIAAFGQGKESWSIEYHVIEGDTSDLQGKAWQGLADILAGEYCGQSISLALVDAGFRTATVYQFCESYSSGVLPCMGESSQSYGRRLFAVRSVPGYATRRVDIQTGQLKGELYGYLNRAFPSEGQEFPVGYCHFPTDYPEKYFMMLTSEERVKERTRSGAFRYVWKLPGSKRNEALDCRVYAMAALYVLAGEVSDDLSPDEPISWESFWALVLAHKAGN